MKVVFIQDVPDVAQAGEIKDVANGHARNYLFPKGFAVLATPTEIKRVEARRQAEARRLDQHIQEAQALAQVFQDISLVFPKRVGAKGNIYGSVSSVAISQELKRLGHTVEKTMVKLEEPLRQLGTHDVDVELAKGVVATIKVTIKEAKEEKVTEEN